MFGWEVMQNPRDGFEPLRGLQKVVLHALMKICSGTLQETLLTGKVGGPVRVHFFGQVKLSPFLSRYILTPPLLILSHPLAKPQQIEVEFKFQSPTLVTGLDIGNFWSARYNDYNVMLLIADGNW